MTANSTQPTANSVSAYLAGVPDQKRRNDATQLLDLMARATGDEPVMWGPSIIGFGSRHYVYESGREGDTPLVAFSARKQALTIYGLFPAPDHENVALASTLGPHTHGKSCLYIKDLNVIDIGVLTAMITQAYHTKTLH